MTRKVLKNGRNEGGEVWAKMLLETMKTEAWRALSTTAQAMYPWIKLEHKGRVDLNGKIRLSCRQVAVAVGIRPDTAARGFQDLQAKGFIVVTEPGRLGFEGLAKGPSYELTELPLPGQVSGRRLYKQWRKGNDFPVCRVTTNNPAGVNGKQKPVTKTVTTLSRKP